MTIDNKQPDNLFRSKLENFEQSPPDWVWDSIQGQLAEKRRRQLFVWVRYGAVAAALVLAFLIGYDWEQNKLPFHSTSPQSVVNSGNEDAAVEPDHVAEVNDKNKPGAKPDEISLTNSGTMLPGRSANAARVAGSELPSREKTSGLEAEVSPERTKSSLFSMTYRTKLKAQLNGKKTSTGELLAMNKLRDESSLSDQDRLIVAQNAARMREVEPDNGKKSWVLGATVAPSVSNNRTGYSESYSRSMNQGSDKSDLSLAGGLTLAMQTKSRWSVQTGVLYNRLGQSSSGSSSQNMVLDAPADGNYFVAGKAMDGEVVISGPAGQIVMDALPRDALVLSAFDEGGASPSVLASSAGLEQIFEYIEIPMLVRYQLIDRKFDLQLMAGLNTGFLVGNSAYQSFGNDRTRIGSTSDMRSVIYTPNLGLGMGYELSPKLQLRLEPQWRYSVESINRNSNVNYRPSTFGLYTGLNYSF